MGGGSLPERRVAVSLAERNAADAVADYVAGSHISEKLWRSRLIRVRIWSQLQQLQLQHYY